MRNWRTTAQTARDRALLNLVCHRAAPSRSVGRNRGLSFAHVMSAHGSAELRASPRPAASAEPDQLSSGPWPRRQSLQYRHHLRGGGPAISISRALSTAGSGYRGP